MSTVLDLLAIAREMKAAQDTASQLEPLTGRLPGFDLAAAYEVADLIHQARLEEGARPVGRKIGFTNPGMWSRYGVREPVWAYVYDTTVVYLDETRVKCRLERFVEPKIEPEIVFGLRKVLRTGAGPAEILDAIDWVAHGFEIVQSHFPGWRFQAPDTVADWALHGTLLVGTPQPLQRLGSEVVAVLESFSLDLTCDDRLVESGCGANVLGSPLYALGHLQSVLAGQAKALPLQAGEIVTTGTITAAHTVQAGQTWHSALRGLALPGLTVEFLS